MRRIEPLLDLGGAVVVQLIRHPTVDAPSGVCYGQLNYPARADVLSALSQRLQHLTPVAEIWSSPMVRCRQLASLLPHRQYREWPELKELDFGRWEGRPWDELGASEVIAWGDDPIERAPPGGESFSQLCQRVLPVIQAIGKRREHSPLLLIAHGGSIRALCQHLLQWPPRQALNTDLDTTHGVRLERRADTWVLQRWNGPLEDVLS